MERNGSGETSVRNRRDMTRLELVQMEIERVEYALQALTAYPALRVTESRLWELHGTLIDLKNLATELKK